jgi:ribosomal protein L29
MKQSSSTSKYNMSTPTQELIKELKQAEKLLFDLRFKKATRQPFKSHEIKLNKKKIATLKNILRDKV